MIVGRWWRGRVLESGEERTGRKRSGGVKYSAKLCADE